MYKRIYLFSHTHTQTPEQIIPADCKQDIAFNDHVNEQPSKRVWGLQMQISGASRQNLP